MPINAGLPILEAQIKASLKLGMGGTTDGVATAIASGIGIIAPMGLLSAMIPPIPPPPAGVTATQSMIKSALSLGMGANPDIVGLQIASAVALACPLVAPAGVGLLGSMIGIALKKSMGATPDLVAFEIANAIINYFLMGGVV